ncbi:MAG: hypothetical protein IPH75_13385 [bacterium]|nr:hypothetical protein [bacterium]
MAGVLISTSASDSQIVKRHVGRDAQNRFYVCWLTMVVHHATRPWYGINADKTAGGTKFGHRPSVARISMRWRRQSMTRKRDRFA